MEEQETLKENRRFLGTLICTLIGIFVAITLIFKTDFTTFNNYSILGFLFTMIFLILGLGFMGYTIGLVYDIKDFL